MPAYPNARAGAPTNGASPLRQSLAIPDLLRLAEDRDGLVWQEFHPGVDIHWIHRENDHGPCAALIRFQPGGRVPAHEHRGFEHIYVLSGSQSDASGLLHAGSLMVHPPGTRHSVISDNGCLVLAIYEKPVQFVAHSDAST